MARKDANDTRRGLRVVTDLSQSRIDARKRGDKPVCGSPLAGSKDPESEKHGKTCKRPAGAGTDHPGYGTCSMHGGLMEAAKKSAARERAASEVGKMRDDMRFYGVHVEVSFEEALLEELQRSVGIVRWIESKLATWGQPEEDGGDWKWDAEETGLPPLLELHEGFRAVTVADTEYAAWLRMYQLERKHLHALAADGIKAGIAKEILVLHQKQMDAMHAIISETLKRLGVQDGDDRLPQVLPAVIREITGRKAG